MHKVKKTGGPKKNVAPKSMTSMIGKTGTGLKKRTGVKKAGGKAAASRRGSTAPPLSPATLTNPTIIAALKDKDAAAQKEQIVDYVRQALGEQPSVGPALGKPRAASTTRDRAAAAADVAVATKALGAKFVLKECGLLEEIQKMLFPNGLDELIARTEDLEISTLKPSASSLSLSSLAGVGDDTTVTSMNTGASGTDAKRGKSTPANAREGSLLLVRALCEQLGRTVEPYMVGGFLAAALDECGSSSSAVREAAEDTATALITLATPFALPRLIAPVLIQSLYSSEWRVKYNVLERMGQCATTAPKQVSKLLPTLIPLVTAQVWDTKPQVNKAAGDCLLAICSTNSNPDVLPAIPSVVTAVCKPNETVKALQELMATTFVAPVDASTLAILCPVLSRGLKEKRAIDKRAACIVIANMSKLVETPEAVAPFGPLLVPELQKVVTNVAFEELRDNALSALNNLTKALGDAATEKANKDAIDEENKRVEAEQQRIDDERKAEEAKERARVAKEEEERKKFKEAMEAQRLLEKMKEDEEAAAKEKALKKKEAAKLSTKGSSGKCQGCGLKKCKKTCLFNSK
jgi:hypothetical protein